MVRLESKADVKSANSSPPPSLGLEMRGGTVVAAVLVAAVVAPKAEVKSPKSAFGAAAEVASGT